ncbi:MAG TPA: NAD-glutamate dehydrogenase domain-containing protein, partial [Myxococcota bacterium]|nr:NAD-glutamate dehydrogenase domain-containing protein [Myxococcota bacterium]
SVDLLWNGGIGTYVKASTETHAAVGDRANESVRIDAGELQARVVGEGGNLGLTQAARVEAARRGVRLDTDAIHNSAGVDLSDHEVNYKILLAQPLRSGEISAEERAAALFEVADEACESVLAHNRAQALSISLDERRARRDIESFRTAIDDLCASQAVSPEELVLPDESTLQARRVAEEGLARPEIAVLLGLAKLHARQAIAQDPFVERPSLEPLFESSFPEKLRARFPEALDAHRLRREITALAVTNRIIDVGGVTAITTMIAKRGLGVPAAAAALLTADEILDGPRLRGELLALRGDVALDEVDDALLSLGAAVQDVARYLLAEELDRVTAEQTRRWSQALFGLAEVTEAFLSGAESDRFGARLRGLLQSGIPESLAVWVAGAPLADRGLNIVRLVERTELPILAVSRAYARLGDATGINWVFQNLPRAAGDDAWDRMVLTDLRTEILSLQRALTEQALRDGPEDPEAAVEAFLASAEETIGRVRGLLPEAQMTPSATSLTVVVQALSRLRPNG